MSARRLTGAALVGVSRVLRYGDDPTSPRSAQRRDAELA